MTQTRIGRRRSPDPALRRNGPSAAPEHMLLALQQGAGNHAVSNMLHRTIAGHVPTERLAQLRHDGEKKATVKGVNGQPDTVEPDQLPWYDGDVKDVLADARVLAQSIRSYNHFDRRDQKVAARNLLPRIVDELQALQTKVEYTLMGVASGYKDDESVELYRAAVHFNAGLIELARTVNDEVAAQSGVQRAGAGRRPDANKERAIDASVGQLGLNAAEQQFMTAFLAGHGANWKARREAMSAIWAIRQGMFTQLESAKQHGQSIAPGGTDVEYLTSDAGKPQMWDQKTLFTERSGFDGRVDHTHTKAHDAQGQGVGILLDSTFEGVDNYEKIWLGFSQMLLSGALPGDALKEVKAPNPGALRADIYVNMTQQAGANPPPEEQNVRWTEPLLAGAQDADGLEIIPAASLGATSLAAVLAGTGNSWARYANNRGWLPTDAYSEYAATGLPNPGKARFVVSDPGGRRPKRVYLSPTHYKGYTVRKVGTGDVNRNAFLRVI